MEKLTLEWLPGRYAVCRLRPDEVIPHWAQVGATPRVVHGLKTTEAQNGGEDAPARLLPFYSLTRTERELSIVIDETLVPTGVQAQRDFVALRIVGTLEFSLVGILARLTGALATAGVPVFVISTFDTDVILIPERDRDRARSALLTVADSSSSKPF